jgi:hypothetical protein
VLLSGGFISIYAEGLPSNASGRFAFADYTAQGGFWSSGIVKDGLVMGISAIPGTWTLSMFGPPGFIPFPASATYFVRANETLNITIAFYSSAPCYQTFTEVGLPVGATWWVIEQGNLAYFSNGTMIDAIGCDGLGGVSVGSATNYVVIAFPSAGTFYPGGASIPVAFGPPAPPLPSPFLPVLAVGLAMGLVVGALSGLGREPGGSGKAPP